MQRLEVSGAVRPIYGSLGVKQLIKLYAIKMYRGVYEQLNTLLNLGLDGGKQSL